MLKKSYQMKLSKEEVSLIEAYRKGTAFSKEYSELQTTANVFIGTPSNCLTVNDAIAQVEALQRTDPDLSLKAFVIPATDNPQIAEYLKHQVLEVIEQHLDQGLPDPNKLN